MTETATRHDPFAALRYPEFVALISGGFLLTSAILIQELVLGYEIYKITRDPLSLGLIGLAEAVPFIGLALVGGYLADKRDKRRLMQQAGAVIMLGSAVLIWVTLPSTRAQLPQAAMLWIIYGSIFLLGLARGIYSPTSSSLRPFLVPRAIYPNSASWGSTFFQAGAILGPLAAGLLYAAAGLTATLSFVLLLMAGNWLLISRIAARPAPVSSGPAIGVWASLREGMDYVRRTRIILYAISLDMFSVLFGGVVALLPVFAEDILKVGPEGLGLLRSAPALGAMLTVLACAWFPPTHHAWRNLLLAVAGFGAATLVFALSRSFVLSAAALCISGACDSVSVVIRSTILQVMTEDRMRGRVSSVNSIFISASNELGAFESGLSARLLGTVPSVVFGACVTFAVVGYIGQRSRELFGVRLSRR